MGGAAACDGGSPLLRRRRLRDTWVTSAVIGKPQPGARLAQCDLLVSLNGRLADVVRDAFLDIRNRSGERFAQLLRVSCALRFTEICNLDQQPVQQIGDA